MKYNALILQFLSLAVVGVLAFASGYLFNETTQTAQARLEKEAALQLKVAPPVEVATLALKPRPWQETLAFTGVVVPWREADLAFAEGGIVKTLFVDKGDTVKGPIDLEPGSPLAMVDRERLEAGVKACEASLAQTVWDLRNQEKLYKENTVSEEAVKQQETLRDLRQAELTQARKSLTDATLRAPFSGMIADRMIELGEAASSQSPAFRLIQLDPIKVTVSVPGRRVNELQAGQPAEVEVQIGPDQTRVFNGKIHYVPPAAKDLLFAVEIALDNPESVLREGMIAQVRLFGKEQQNLYVLPLETVIQVGTQRQVMLMERKGEVVDGYYDLGYLPPVEQKRVLESLNPKSLNPKGEDWFSVPLETWSSFNLTAVDCLAAKVTTPKVHRLRGQGVKVYHLGPRARMQVLNETRIEGDCCLVPDNGILHPGDLLIARGQYRVTDGGEVRLSQANELSLPGGVDSE
ncbi:MAG: efflux RND transporter periplasmic adaptor subunit [Planctomycetota bacterium]